MTIGGDYDSPEKEFVRINLWDPAFLDLINGNIQKADALKILDLPGAKCHYLQHVIDQFGISKTNIVAAEQHEEAFVAIHSFLEGSGSVFHGLVEDICESKQIDTYFPVDVANLDFCGQGFVFPDLATNPQNRSEYQRRWDCIKYVIDSNRKHEKQTWYLLLTLSCDRNNAAGKKYLLSQLAEINGITGQNKTPATWSDARLIQEVVPKIVADEALQRGYVPDHVAFDSYRYVQTGHRTHMVAWRIRFNLDTDKSLGSHMTRRNKFLQEFCKHYSEGEPKEVPKTSDA